MNRDLTKQEAETLEAIIDASSLQAVVMALSEICGEKSEHVLTNWQDKALAREWAEACGQLGVLAVTGAAGRLSR
jgi:uncharacterized protein with HEPN domain